MKKLILSLNLIYNILFHFFAFLSCLYAVNKIFFLLVPQIIVYNNNSVLLGSFIFILSTAYLSKKYLIRLALLLLK